MKLRSLVLGSLISCAPAFGAQLIKDVNAVPTQAYSGSTSFEHGVAVAQGTLFRLDDGVHGNELWLTDGTPAGTRLLKDIQPGPASSNLDNLTLLNGLLLFWADDGANGIELWRSDGTADGTRMVANIGPGAQSGADFLAMNTPMTVLNGVAYFSGFDAATGGELWRTDGTAAGTYRLADVFPGAEGSFTTDFIIVGSRVYFSASSAPGSRELWSTDGTPAGTRRATAVPANVFQGLPTPPVVAGNALFFVGDDGTHGGEIWRVSGDGTTGGMIRDLNTMGSPAGANKTVGSEPGGLFVLGNEVVFGAMTMTGPNFPNAVRHYGLYRANATNNTLTLITETQWAIYPALPISVPGGALFKADGYSILWRTDGTAAGTGPMTTVNVEYGGFAPLVKYDGNLAYFYARHPGSSNFDLWRTDGTVAGTREYALLDAALPASDIVSLNGRLYFGLWTVADGTDLWTSDGTPGGTHVVHDDGAGIESGGVSTLIASAGRLYFVAFDTDGIPEPWVSDGTDAGTLRIADITVKTFTEGSNPVLLGSVGTNVFFRANDGVNGLELWVTDGTSAGTRLLTTAQPEDPLLATPGPVVSLGNGIGLFELTDSAGTELWRTDGTVAGTTRVIDLYPGPIGAKPFASGRVVMNGVLYFGGTDGGNGGALWRSDGTAAGTQPVANIPQTGSSGNIYIWSVVANSRVFLSSYGVSPTLYSSDGTAPGTIVVQSNFSPSAPYLAVKFQNRACVVSWRAQTDSEVYCSNGTAGDLAPITDFGSLGTGATDRMYVVNGTLVVDAIGPGGVGGIYATDGTPGGLHKISDDRIDSEAFPVNGGAHYAWTVQDSSGVDIFVTDGTQAGTHSVLTGAAPAHINVQPSFGVFNDSIVFWVNDPDKSYVLWKVNVDGSGARYLTDVDPLGVDGPWEGNNFLQNGAKLFFCGSRVDIGNELWTITATDPNSTDDYATTAFNTQVAINVLDNDADFDGSLNPGSIEIVTPPASGTVAINAATGAINYTPNTGFSGGDVFVYRVADTGGRFSNPSTVSVITLTSNVNTGPGTAPTPPPPSGGGSSGGGSSSGGGGGGGGALGLEVLLLLWLLVPRLRLRARRSKEWNP